MSTNTALDDIKARVEGRTEGLWEAFTSGRSGGDHWHVCADDEAIAHISANDGIDEERRRPNAELFAAAPKLLAALEAVLSHASAEVEEYHKYRGGMTEYDQLEAAGRAGYAEELAQRIQDALS